MNKKSFADAIYQMAVDSRRAELRHQRDELRQALASLLKETQFTEVEGVWLKGKEVAVWIDPQEQDTSAFAVLITVQPLHAPRRDLEGVPLTLIRKNGVTLLRPPSLKLNRRGQAMFQNLPPGTYGVIVQKHKVSPPLPLPARYYEENYRQAVNFDTESALFEEHTVGDFTCTVEAAREPQSVDILLSFETNQPIKSRPQGASASRRKFLDSSIGLLTCEELDHKSGDLCYELSTYFCREVLDYCGSPS